MNFSYENANAEVPQFWNEAFMQEAERPVMGMYGVCFDEEMASNEFRCMIADGESRTVSKCLLLPRCITWNSRSENQESVKL